MRLVQRIKEKHYGEIKGRTCVDDRSQCEYISKEASTSPTVYVESLFLVIIIAVMEGRSVGVVDIPGDFLTTTTDENIVEIVDGLLVDMLVKSNPKYKEFVYVSKSKKKIVYLRLKKAMYGTLRAARLFYER